MGDKTLATLGKILAEDKKSLEKARKASDSGKAYPMMGPTELGEELRIKKADAGGIILCYYGPNGSREFVAKDVKEALPMIEKYFDMGGESAGDEESDD